MRGRQISPRAVWRMWAKCAHLDTLDYVNGDRALIVCCSSPVAASIPAIIGTRLKGGVKSMSTHGLPSPCPSGWYFTTKPPVTCKESACHRIANSRCFTLKRPQSQSPLRSDVVAVSEKDQVATVQLSERSQRLFFFLYFTALSKCVHNTISYRSQQCAYVCSRSPPPSPSLK